jgi:hypothetical protein
MPFTTFDVNIFGTSHVNLDGSNSNGYSREFVIHVLQVECNQIITNFDMFIEFYAYPFRKGTFNNPTTPSPIGLWLNAFNIDEMKLNGRPQVIHLDTMTPNSVIDLYPSCTIPTPPCPSPSDMRLTSQTFQVPISTSSPTGYKQTVTDMYDEDTDIAKLPVNITIIADNCRYSSEIGTTINIYKEYIDGVNAALFGGSLSNPNNYPIGFNEKITIS